MQLRREFCLIKNFQNLVEIAKKQDVMSLVVAAAEDSEVLKAVVEAGRQGIVRPILVGAGDLIRKIASENDLDISGFEIIESDSLEKSAEISVRMVNEGKADFLMKGLLDTSILLKAVLDKEYGLRTDSQLSHVMIYDVPNYHKLIYMTDGGMNIAPNYLEKKKILTNAISAAKALGNEEVKVACLAAKEKVNEKMLATIDGDRLAKDSQNGDFGSNVIVEGPLALDLAISKEAAKMKGFDSEVSGEVDILMVPTIEVGNALGKSLTYFAGAKSAGVIMGASSPVVLVSRADDFESKLYSIAFGSVIAANIEK